MSIKIAAKRKREMTVIDNVLKQYVEDESGTSHEVDFLISEPIARDLDDESGHEATLFFNAQLKGKWSGGITFQTIPVRVWFDEGYTRAIPVTEDSKTGELKRSTGNRNKTDGSIKKTSKRLGVLDFLIQREGNTEWLRDALAQALTLSYDEIPVNATSARKQEEEVNILAMGESEERE